MAGRLRKNSSFGSLKEEFAGEFFTIIDASYVHFRKLMDYGIAGWS
jgi:hypothetical protein